MKCVQPVGKTCGPGQTLQGSTCVCLPGYSWVSSAQCIKCPSTSSWNGQTCACRNGFELKNNQCVRLSCGPGQILEGNSCVCLPGYIWVSSIKCIKCQPNSFWNGERCACNNNYYLLNGICTRCPPNSSYNSTTKTCVCNPPLFLNGQRCTSCKSN